MEAGIQITDKAAQRDLLHSFRQKLGFQATFREVLADFQRTALKAITHGKHLWM